MQECYVRGMILGDDSHVCEDDAVGMEAWVVVHPPEGLNAHAAALRAQRVAKHRRVRKPDGRGAVQHQSPRCKAVVLGQRRRDKERVLI